MMSSVSFKVVIPARYDSSRLPGKVLLDLAGKPMLEHVYQRAVESGADQIVIATDHDKVYQAAKAFGAEVCMTHSDHCSGTDRIAEVCDKYQWADDEVVVNLQGDEPLIDPELLYQVATDLQQHPQAEISTLCTAITNTDELFDPHAVKVVFDKNNFALYFSRAPIPWNRDQFTKMQAENIPSKNDIGQAGIYHRHLGIYCYRVSFLNTYSTMQPCDLENLEALEQLRALWYGHKIYISTIDCPPGHGVDTEQDLQRVSDLLSH